MFARLDVFLPSAVLLSPQERGLTTVAGVGQDLFIGRMAAHANGVGYPPPDQSQEDWQQVTTEMPAVLDLEE